MQPDPNKCPNCNVPKIGGALGPSGAKLEAAGICPNCGRKYSDGTKVDPETMQKIAWGSH